MNDPYYENLCTPILLEETFTRDLPAWLAQTARIYHLTWMLLHADDGVIWGKLEADGSFSTSHMAFPEVSPALRVETVQQLRLFSVHGEVHLWKTQDGFNARVIQDQAVHQDPSRFYDETQWLYGAANQQKSGYTLMIEGEEGLEHAIPLTGSPGFRAGLKVRHYVAYDDQGQAYIPLSRLLELTIVEGRSI